MHEVHSQGSQNKSFSETNDNTSTNSKGCSASTVLANADGALGGIKITMSYGQTTPIKSVDCLNSQFSEPTKSGKLFLYFLILWFSINLFYYFFIFWSHSRFFIEFQCYESQF